MVTRITTTRDGWHHAIINDVDKYTKGDWIITFQEGRYWLTQFGTWRGDFAELKDAQLFADTVSGEKKSGPPPEFIAEFDKTLNHLNSLLDQVGYYGAYAEVNTQSLCAIGSLPRTIITVHIVKSVFGEPVI